METSRRALDRLLDPENTSITLHTLQRAAAAVGRRLHLELR
ncbi:MAG: Fis family transcriptional regulator, partial [Acidobacteriota bacterium]